MTPIERKIPGRLMVALDPNKGKLSINGKEMGLLSARMTVSQKGQGQQK
jgi:hypothetical protein